MQTRRRSTQTSLRESASDTPQDENQTEDFDKLAEDITDRIWALWRKELRRDRERSGHKPRR